MFRRTPFKILLVISLLTFMFCNNVSQPDTAVYGSISGKIVHPDDNLFIRLISDGGTDTAIFDPETRTFSFDSVKYGNCILEVSAEGYQLFKKEIQLTVPLYVCNDITLSLPYGSISGKIFHPDNNLFIRLISDGKTDTATHDPESQIYVFDSIQYGSYILEVSANDYEPFHENIQIDTPLYICDDIVLTPQYGSISGKILYPETDLTIRILPEDGRVDFATVDPVTQTFTFNNVKTGNCIIQISADGYGLHEQIFLFNKPHFIFPDIALSHTPSAVSYLFPSNSQNIDSVYCSLFHSAITDTGFQVVITLNSYYDSTTVYEALTVLPDTVGMQRELVNRQSLVVFFPYWKLATIDTVQITVARQGKFGRFVTDEWDDTLDFDYTVFFPVDTHFVRTNFLE